MRFRIGTNMRNLQDLIERLLDRPRTQLERGRLSLALWLGEIVHRLTALPSAFREVSLRRAIAYAALTAVIATPSAMYLMERGQRLAKERAYEALTLSAAVETGFLRASMSNLLAERAQLADALLDAGYTVHTGNDIMVKVVATGYSSSIYETDSTPFITAANTSTRDGILALSRDLLKRYTPGAPFDFGDRVHLPGLGEFIVEDSMNSRWNNRVDIWFPSRLEALRFGVKEVYLRTLDEDLTTPDELSEVEPASDVDGL